MSPEAQRIAIAEACGWKAHVDGLGYYQGVHPALMGGRAIPDYLNDLNAMHKAENVLPAGKWTRYCQYLAEFGQGSVRFVSVHSNAAQRAEAFLRTIGKWEGAK